MKKALAIIILVIVLVLAGFIGLGELKDNIKVKKGDSGLYRDKVELKIKKKSGYTYYYTLDGSTPDKHDKKYKNSLKVDESTVVKVRGFSAKDKTDVLELSYVIQNDITKDIKKMKKKDGNMILEVKKSSIVLGTYDYDGDKHNTKRKVDYADNCVYAKVSGNKVSMLTLEDLQKAVEENPVFAYIVYDHNYVQEVVVYE